jgi:hypothetical protein
MRHSNTGLHAMKVPQVPAMPGMTPLGVLNPLSQDQATIAKRAAAAPLRASKPQASCDIGLFSDGAAQVDLCDLLAGGKR